MFVLAFSSAIWLGVNWILAIILGLIIWYVPFMRYAVIISLACLVVKNFFVWCVCNPQAANIKRKKANFFSVLILGSLIVYAWLLGAENLGWFTLP